MKLSLFFILLISGLAWSQTQDPQKKTVVPQNERSEFFYQPEEGEINFKFTYGTSQTEKTTITSGASSYIIDGSSQGVTIDYLYGLSSHHAIGLNVSYGSSQSNSTFQNSTSSSKSVGPSDIFFMYKGLSSFNKLILRWNASVSWSPENAVTADTQHDGNRYSGSYAIFPGVSLEKQFDQMRAGLTVGYKYQGIRKTQKASNSNSTTETNGGDSSSLGSYLEWIQNQHLLGVALNYSTLNKSQSTTSSGTSYETPSSELYTLLLSYTYEARPHFSYILQAGRMQFSSPAVSANLLQAGLRWGF